MNRLRVVSLNQAQAVPNIPAGESQVRGNCAPGRAWRLPGGTCQDLHITHAVNRMDYTCKGGSLSIHAQSYEAQNECVQLTATYVHGQWQCWRLKGLGPVWWLDGHLFMM